jgi:hypothetical protein
MRHITHLSTKSFASFLLDVVSSSDFDKNIMTCPTKQQISQIYSFYIQDAKVMD